MVLIVGIGIGVARSWSPRAAVVLALSCLVVMITTPASTRAWRSFLLGGTSGGKRKRTHQSARAEAAVAHAAAAEEEPPAPRGEGAPVPGRLRVYHGATAEVRSVLWRLVACAAWYADGDAAVPPLPGEGALRLPCGAAWAVVLRCSPRGLRA